MAKLSLCVIVGKDSAEELENLLKSTQGPLFDEIIVTTTQQDEEVKKVANKYADKVPHFEWIKDFSAARNFCFDQATGTHIMWLDSDDILKPEQYNKIFELKKDLDNWDSIMFTYNYSSDGNGNPITVLPRERIVRKHELLRWENPIHEVIPRYSHLRNLDRLDISIDHDRKGEYHAGRNLEILKHQYDSGKASPRMKFYYAKDLFESGEKEVAVKIFEEYLRGPSDFHQNQAIACLRLATYYREKKDSVSELAMLRKGILYESGYAEFYYHIGRHYENKGDFQEAAANYIEATKKNPLGLFGANRDYYRKLPINYLIQILYHKLGRKEDCLKYTNLFLEWYPNDQNFLFNKKSLESELSGNKPLPVPEELRPKEPSVPEEKIASQEQPAVVQEFKGELKVAWLIRQIVPEDPSQRIRRLNVSHTLNERGVKSEIISNYQNVSIEWLINKLSAFDVIISAAFDQGELNLIKKLREQGQKVFIDFNEAIQDMPQVQACLKEADGVICCSRVLLEKAKPHSKIVAIVEDAVEPADEQNQLEAKNEKPVALFIGMGGNSFLVTDYLKDTIEKAGYELKVCTEWDNADIPWSLDTWEETMLSAQVVLCPQRVEVQPAKSNIKAAQAMSMGIPVIASPLPAYKEFIESGKNGYLCANKDEWLKALIELKDVRKRIQIGLNGKEAAKQFSLEAIALKWEKTVRIMMQDQRLPTKKVASVPTVPVTVPTPPAVSGVRQPVPIIIPVYKGVQYLKACITSIHMNTLHPYHIILSDAGSDAETWEYLSNLKGITVLGKQGERKSFSEACNAGVAHVGTAKYFALLNSDVIVSKGWLTNIIAKMDTEPRLASCGVLSNCDIGFLHSNPRRPELGSYNMTLPSGFKLYPGMKYEETMPHLDELYAFMENSNKEHAGKFVEHEWTAYYATVFAKSAWDETGPLDPIFQSGCEDLDHAIRMKKLGYRNGQAIDSFVYHFGGVSRGAYQTEDKEAYDAIDVKNHEIYHKKWAKKRVIIYTGPAWEPWDRVKVESGMAGSETWAAELGARFSRLGYETVIFNEPVVDGARDRDGVLYLHYSRLEEYTRYKFIDYTILSRTCQPIGQVRLHSGKIFCMIHDIWLSQDKNYNTYDMAISKYGVLSEWHRDFVAGHHTKLPKQKTFLTMNGVDHSLYGEIDHTIKKNKAVYSSSPDRGLRQLLEMMPAIRAEVPDFELEVAYGFHNWEAAAKHRNNPAELANIDHIKKLMEQPGVTYLGRISKKKLAQKQKEAKVWAFPTWFSETFCVTAVESGLAGNAVVTTPYAGLLTTLGDTATYIKTDSGGDPVAMVDHPQYRERFIKEVVRFLKDEPYRQERAKAVYEKVKGYTWENAAKGWIEQFGN